MPKEKASAFERGQKQYAFVRKHAKLHRYHISGPPRALESEYDNKNAVREAEDGTAEGVKQRMAQREARDRSKVFGTKDLVIQERTDLPPKPRIKNADFWSYAIAGWKAAGEGRCGTAYWYFTKAALAAPSHGEELRFAECAKANLKTWRQINTPIS